MRAADGFFWLTLRRFWPRWKEALVVIRPDTVVRWHRAGFRKFWTWKSRRGGVGRRSTTAEIRAVVRRMAAENPTRGAPRIHGELLMLGFDVSERTVSRVLPRRPADPETRQRWRNFHRNHREVLAVIDHMDIRRKQITPYSPWQNGVAERWVATVRRDLLDHVIVLNERHLHRLHSEFVAYYHDDRTHLGLGKSTPSMRTATSKPNGLKARRSERSSRSQRSVPRVRPPKVVIEGAGLDLGEAQALGLAYDAARADRLRRLPDAHRGASSDDARIHADDESVGGA